jgi:L-amino acid N-acyltransferase YncA
MRSLHNGAFRGVANSPDLSMDDVVHACGRAWPDGSGVWADSDGALLAFAWCIRDRDAEGDHILVDAIGVHETARGRGVGTAVLHHVLAESERAGVAEVRAIVAEDNVASLALHRRAGFRERSRRAMLQLDLRGKRTDGRG